LETKKRLQPTCAEAAFATQATALATPHHSRTSSVGMFFTTAASITSTGAPITTSTDAILCFLCIHKKRHFMYKREFDNSSFPHEKIVSSFEFEKSA
jgi:hypothetical protein